MTNQQRMKDIKNQQKDLSKKAKESEKTNPDESKKTLDDMMKLMHEQQRMNMKPMLATFVLVFAFFPWVGSLYNGPIINLPVSLPYFGNDFGWIMWYVVTSLPLSLLFRKILDVEL